ncbi:MAG: hypothetical protein K2M95_04765, partial [Clostridiales bacterium]|nr:hypothetical protein [Clostridiales bacterium]
GVTIRNGGQKTMADKAKKEYGALKKRAMLAKQRLKMGYWQKMVEERQKALESFGKSEESLQLVQSLQREKVKRDEQKALSAVRADEEEVFYAKVCSILEEDENTTNPIGRLIDRGRFDQLDENNKQLYILRLAEKFRQMRDRYYRERAGKAE